MQEDIQLYNSNQSISDSEICNCLANMIDRQLKKAICKIWHANPVWFINENPIVGYSKQKKGIRLMFWSGASFETEGLLVLGGKFKDASIFYTECNQINKKELKNWLKESILIQWDYKNIVKRKGRLEKIDI